MARKTFSLGTKIQELRKARGWRREDLAHYSGLGVASIARIEALGAEANPKLETLERLANALEVSVLEFFDANIYLRQKVA